MFENKTVLYSGPSCICGVEILALVQYNLVSSGALRNREETVQSEVGVVVLLCMLYSLTNRIREMTICCYVWTCYVYEEIKTKLRLLKCCQFVCLIKSSYTGSYHCFGKSVFWDSWTGLRDIAMRVCIKLKSKLWSSSLDTANW